MPESLFDEWMAAHIRDWIPGLNARARLVVDLREALGLRPTTEGSAFQRIRDAKQRGRPRMPR